MQHACEHDKMLCNEPNYNSALYKRGQEILLNDQAEKYYSCVGEFQNTTLNS